MPNTTEPDFEVRNLSEYSAEDLLILYKALSFAEIELNSPLVIVEGMSKETFRQSLDIWGYRIKDALKEAKKRENS